MKDPKTNETGLLFYDSEGNEYTITGGKDDILFLKGTNGEEKKIHYNDLHQFTPYPPDVMEAATKVVEMLRSGELTIDELRTMMEAL